MIAKLVTPLLDSGKGKEEGMLQIDPMDKVGILAARFPESLQVFTKRGIDFCCGGQLTLDQACKDRNLDPGTVAEEIRFSQDMAGEGVLWSEQPLSELIDFILRRFHHPLSRDILYIEAVGARVLSAHRDKDEHRLKNLLQVVRSLQDGIVPHLYKEEQVLFPWIRSGNGGTAGDPIRVMHLEHEETASELRWIRELTDDFRPPGYACETVLALYAALERLDADLREHIHLENNILFPRALRE